MDATPEREVADLRTLLNITQRLAVTVELSALLRGIVQAATRVLACERATVFLYAPDTHELYSVMAEGADGIRFSADEGIAGEVVRTGRVVNVPDAYADPRFHSDIDRQLGFRTRNLLTLPLRDFEGRLVGVLQALNKHDADGGFTSYDERLAAALSAQAGVAVQRHTLLEQYAVKRKQDGDLEFARSIQQGFLPKQNPQVCGFDIAGWNRPADQTGGDWYDFFRLDDGRLVVTLADAVGHGIPAALLMTECRALMRALLPSLELPAVLERVNRILSADLAADQFVTAFVGIIDPQQRKLTYISAGQGPLLYYRARDGRTAELAATTFPLAVVDDATFEPEPAVQLAPGDMMAVVTDGFHEWRQPDREGIEPDAVGVARLSEIIAQHATAPAAEIIERLHEAVVAFVGPDAIQSDDLTAVIIKCSDPFAADR